MNGGGDADALAAAAAAAASEGGTAQGAMVMKELAKLTPQMSHPELQGAAANAALAGLRAAEAQAKCCIQLLVQALAVQQGPDLAADAVWTLNKLTRSCEVSQQWVLDAGGSPAIKQALLTYPERNDLVLCCIWMTYNLEGLQGLAAILACGHDGAANGAAASRGAAANGANGTAAGGATASGGARAVLLTDAVAAATVWVVYELTQEESRKSKPLPAEMSGVLRLIVQLLANRSHCEEVLKACCFTIEALVREEPSLRSLLAEIGGVPLLLISLRRAAELGDSAEELARVCASAVASLADGGLAKEARALFQNSGAAEALQRIALRGTGSPAEERAMIALGQLSGLGVVMHTMAQAPEAKAVVRGGLDAIAELAGQVSADPDEVRRLPGMLGDLMELKSKMDGPSPAVKCRRKCGAAICAVVRSLAPHAGPGQVQELDRAVCLLLESLRSEPWTDPEVAEMFVEALGRVSLVSGNWRHALQQGGALERAAAIIRGLHGQRKLMKYSFWFTAALVGLGFVVQELQQNLQSKEVADAAFCTIIDILDDDIEGDWVLNNTDQCAEADVPRILALICQAMQQHPQDSFLQSRGCHCIGLLLPVSPPGPELPAAVRSVFGAVRQHMRSSEVARDACYVFRNIFEMGAGRSANDRSSQVREALLAVLQQERAEVLAEQALVDFADSREPELLEDAVVILAALAGVGAATRAIADSHACAVRICGVKALFEFGGQHPQILRGCAAEVAQAVTAMVSQSPDDHNLQRNASLLLGLCEAM